MSPSHPNSRVSSFRRNIPIFAKIFCIDRRGASDDVVRQRLASKEYSMIKVRVASNQTIERLKLARKVAMKRFILMGTFGLMTAIGTSSSSAAPINFTDGSFSNFSLQGIGGSDVGITLTDVQCASCGNPSQGKISVQTLSEQTT